LSGSSTRGVHCLRDRAQGAGAQPAGADTTKTRGADAGSSSTESGAGSGRGRRDEASPARMASLCRAQNSGDRATAAIGVFLAPPLADFSRGISAKPSRPFMTAEKAERVVPKKGGAASFAELASPHADQMSALCDACTGPANRTQEVRALEICRRSSRAPPVLGPKT
jgi:hypothetical protein